MNYAVLSKIKALSGNTLDLLEQTRQATRLSKSQNRAETAFYLSAEDATVFYILSYWYNLQDFHEACARAAQEKNPAPHKVNREILSSTIFQLFWDYRRVHLPVVASSLHLLTYPESMSENCYQETVTTFRRLKEKVPGVTGIWIGRCLNPVNRLVSLSRSDWSSLAEQQAFFNSGILQLTMKRFQEEGGQVEVASFDLQGLVQPPVQLPESKDTVKMKVVGIKHPRPTVASPPR